MSSTLSRDSEGNWYFSDPEHEMNYQRWHVKRYEALNSNEKLRIEGLKPFPSTKKKRKGARLLSPHLKRVRRNQGDDQLNLELGSLALLGTDNLFEILTRVDVNTLLSCLRVNRTLLTFITSPSFRRSWRGKNGVLIGSRTLPWRLLTNGEPESSPFRLLNNPRCPGEVLASAGGLLCINTHPTNEILELAVGNPLTQEWLLLPLPEQEFPITCRMSFRMEVFSGGHFKVAAHERAQWLYRVFVYDSGSEWWGVTELHYPPMSFTRWSVYDLRRSWWRTSLVSRSRGIEACYKAKLRGEEEYHELSHPFDHGFCVWEYRNKSYFASPWLGLEGKTLTGYGVWELDESTGKLTSVSSVHCGKLANHPLSLYWNDINGFYTSCNAFENMVCFMGKSPAQPAMPLAAYNLESDSWVRFRLGLQTPVPKLGEKAVKADEHYTVAIVYSPSLLAPPAQKDGYQTTRGKG